MARFGWNKREGPWCRHQGLNRSDGKDRTGAARSRRTVDAVSGGSGIRCRSPSSEMNMTSQPTAASRRSRMRRALALSSRPRRWSGMTRWRSETGRRCPGRRGPASGCGRGASRGGRPRRTRGTRRRRWPRTAGRPLCRSGRGRRSRRWRRARDRLLGGERQVLSAEEQAERAQEAGAGQVADALGDVGTATSATARTKMPSPRLASADEVHSVQYLRPSGAVTRRSGRRCARQTRRASPLSRRAVRRSPGLCLRGCGPRPWPRCWPAPARPRPWPGARRRAWRQPGRGARRAACTGCRR